MKQKQKELTQKELVTMVTSEGFESIFWQKLRLFRYDNPLISRKDVFYVLNEAYEKHYKKPRYKSYDAFRMAMKRRNS